MEPAEPTATGPATLVDWLRARSDLQLAALLQVRPDLGLPAPPDLLALAGRLTVRSSVQRAVDALDAHTLAVLESLVLAADTDGIVPADSSADDVGAPLLERGLAWVAGDGRLHLLPTVRDAVGTYPGGLGRPWRQLLRRAPDVMLVPVLRALGLPPAPQPQAGTAAADHLEHPQRLSDMIAELDAEERHVLDRLAAGPPVGSLRSVTPTAEDGEPSAPYRLIERGLLVPIDSSRVELPREVGLAIRGARDERMSNEPPVVPVIEHDPGELDRLGTTDVLETLRLVDALAEEWARQPPPLLRSGGLGVRELRRTSRALSTEDATVALLAETTFAAGLINSSSGMEPVFLPTAEYDEWHERDPAARWTTLATAWLTMTRQPSLAGERDERDRVTSALGPEAERGTVPALRRRLLELLAELPPGGAPQGVEDVLDRFTWFQPRRASGQRALAATLLAEADQLGLTAAGGITGYTRTLLSGGAVPSTVTLTATEHALDHALPEPVDHFLVQPDLTVVVPGPPAPAIATELALVADLESTGGASVYRITEQSVRRALDYGRSGPALREFVTEHSRTPIPQALSYLIDDASRRHGVLRAGTAGAYLRCDDEALLGRVVAAREVDSLALRLLAPTVVITDASVMTLLEVLRSAGFAPAAESAGGDVVTLLGEAPRAPSRPAPRVSSRRGDVDPQAQSLELVRRLRAGDAAQRAAPRVSELVQGIPGVTSAATMNLLRTAIRESRLVHVGYADASGTETSHTIAPISLAAGTVRGYEPGSSTMLAIPVHRLTTVRPADDLDETD